MFTVGKKYEFRLIEEGSEVTFHGTVETYDHPLVKLEDTKPITVSLSYTTPDGRVKEDTPKVIPGGTPGRIINVTSTYFLSAREVRPKV